MILALFFSNILHLLFGMYSIRIILVMSSSKVQSPCWVIICINPLNLSTISFGVDAAMELEEKHQVFNAAGEELSAAKHKLMLLDTAAERRLMLLSQVKTINEKCCC
nr:hypothetical protein [Tanacetum cinerariifolium]